MSGTLHHLGLYVPGPYYDADESNPKGYFESRWAVRYHKEIATLARVNDFDSRPGALERMRTAVTPKLRRKLLTFLIRQSAEHD